MKIINLLSSGLLELVGGEQMQFRGRLSFLPREETRILKAAAANFIGASFLALRVSPL